MPLGLLMDLETHTGTQLEFCVKIAANNSGFWMHSHISINHIGKCRRGGFLTKWNTASAFNSESEWSAQFPIVGIYTEPLSLFQIQHHAQDQYKEPSKIQTARPSVSAAAGIRSVCVNAACLCCVLISNKTHPPTPALMTYWNVALHP